MCEVMYGEVTLASVLSGVHRVVCEVMYGEVTLASVLSGVQGCV